MGLYSKYIYPRIVDYILSNPGVAGYRKELLSHVKGQILEIGFGTGLNLPYYPVQYEKLLL